MKSFDDFLNLSNDRFPEFLENVLSEHFQDGENLSADRIVSKTLTISREITLDTLRLYHDWLANQIHEEQIP